MRGINARISGPMLKEVALDFAKNLELKSSPHQMVGLNNSKKRPKISEKILCGESMTLTQKL